ncbi:MAG: HPr kinase/phosphatase C-terminal domain-containing protein [Pseudomonadota bacterium]
MSADQSTLIQATAIAIEGRALMVEGEPGSGKSSLALALIERGAQLIGDDGVQLTREGQAIIASPPPNITGKLEIWGVGIVELPTVSAPLALILSLADDAPRYREAAETREILGVAVPTLPFSPGTIAPAERVLWALRTHGQIQGLAFG